MRHGGVFFANAVLLNPSGTQTGNVNISGNISSYEVSATEFIGQSLQLGGPLVAATINATNGSFDNISAYGTSNLGTVTANSISTYSVGTDTFSGVAGSFTSSLNVSSSVSVGQNISTYAESVTNLNVSTIAISEAATIGNSLFVNGNVATRTFSVLNTANINTLLLSTPLSALYGGTGYYNIPIGVLLGQGPNATQVAIAKPVSAGYVLTDNGPGSLPTFQANAGSQGGVSVFKTFYNASVTGTTVTLNDSGVTLLYVGKNGSGLAIGTDVTVVGSTVTFTTALSTDTIFIVYTTSSTFSGAVTFQHEEYTPANTATTVTLSQTPGTVLFVARGSGIQRAGTDYTIAGSVLTFTSAFDGVTNVIIGYGSQGTGAGNASSLNGYNTALSPSITANTIPVTDASGKLGSNYKLIGAPTVYTSGSNTYTTPAGADALLIQLIGGGGAGGGFAATSTNQGAAGGGGGGGAFAQKWFANPTGNYTVVVGAGGTTGSAGAAGNNGNDSTFNSTTCVAKGGTGGNSGVAVSTPAFGATGGVGGSGGSSTGDITISGQAGGPGVIMPSGGIYGGGPGGTSSMGAGGTASGLPSVGGGGQGGTTGPNSSNGVGNTGAAGIAIIYAYSKAV